ncbi:MAG: TIM barrel protein [Sedimentisphaerales bacterium]|nr:TIM barrel protein [Sedimentisphaerales bacterium]
MKTGLAAGATAISTMAATTKAKGQTTSSAPFNLKYAPSFGQFRENAGNDPIDQIKFMADQGFRALFDNGLMGKSPDLQERIAKELEAHGMDLGPFVLYADFGKKTFVTRDPEVRDMLIKRMKEGVECCKRTNAQWALVVPGAYDTRLEWDYQTANCVDNLRYCGEIFQEAGRIIVIEPLNWWRDHPGLFLTKIPQAYQICRAVNNPSVKIVNDLYHQQITEGNLIPNIDLAWDQIAAFHIGDNPGRQEPTTGEINYLNVFKHIHRKGYQGVLCMEHGRSRPGKEGEMRVIQAYRECDSFEI